MRPGSPVGASSPLSSRTRTSEPGQAVPTEPGPGEPLLRGDDAAAAFRRRVVLGHHRPPPVEHPPLDLGRARRGGVDHAPQRADVVPGADRLGQRQQPPELRRHHVAAGHPVPLDQGEQVLRIEAVHQHDRVAEGDGDRREVQHRRVVERRAAQVDVAVVRLEAEDGEEPGGERRHRVRVLAGQRPAHALGAARRARRVEHRGAGRALPRAAGAACAELGQRGEPGDVADREPGAAVDARLVGRGRRDVGEPLVRDERARLAVAEDVGDLGRGQVPVDRDHVEPGLQRGEEQRERVGAVRQHPGHGRAGAEPERLQSPAEPVGPGGQLGVADDRAVGLDRRRPVRGLRCDGPQADVAHGPNLERVPQLGQAITRTRSTMDG